MDLTTIIIVIAFLAITAFLGYLGWRQTKTTSDYLLAGRQTHPLIMAVSYGSTFISTSAIVGFGGAASKFGMGILWLTFLNIIVGIFLAFIVFGKRTRRMGHALGAHTFPELIAKRFNSRFLQIGCGLVIFIGMPLYAGAVLLGGATYLVQSLAITKELAILILVVIVTAYVMFGGMKGVMYTDAFQGGIMFIGMIILLVVTYATLGGVAAAHDRLAALPAQLDGPSKALADAWAKDGFTGWMSMPTFGSPMWMQLVSSLVLGVGVGVLAQPQLIVRFMTVKSDRELNRGVLIGGIFIFVMTGVTYVCGALSNVWFWDLNHLTSIAGTVSDATPKGFPDAVIPNFIGTAMPWFNAIFMVVLLAAAMSTMSSQVHTMGTSLGRDVIETGTGYAAKKGNWVVRLAMLAGIGLSAILAWYLPIFFGKDGTAVIATGTSLFFGLCASAFLPLFAFGLFWKGVTRRGAVAGFVVGLAISLIWLLFFYGKVSGSLGLCKALFNAPSLVTGFVRDLDPIIVATPLAAVVTWLVSLFSPRFSAEHLDKIAA